MKPSRALFAVAVAAALSASFAGPQNAAVAQESAHVSNAAAATQPAGPLDFKVQDIDGKDVDLSQYKGKVVLVVNVASKCGYTPQYAGLQKLYEGYKDKGFVVLGFPADNFKHQEPGTNLEIKEFCTSKYNVSFPMMSKISVKGEDKHPLYKALTEAPASPFPGEVSWNFNKFLIGKDGKLVARYDSKVKPDDAKLTGEIDAELAKK